MSGAELRILAEMSGSKMWIDAFNRKEDERRGKSRRMGRGHATRLHVRCGAQEVQVPGARWRYVGRVNSGMPDAILSIGVTGDTG